MASDFNSIARAIRYLGDCVRYLADKYVAVNDRVYSDWNEASKVVGDVGRRSSSSCGNSPRASLSSLIRSNGVSSMIVSLHWA